MNGLLYRLKLVVGATSCMREEEEEYEAALTRCAKTNDDDVWGSTQTCDVDVLVRPKPTDGQTRQEEAKGKTKEGDGEKGGGEKPEVEMEAILARGSYDESCYFD